MTRASRPTDRAPRVRSRARTGAALRTAVGQDPESDAPLPIADSNVAPESEKPEM